MYPYTRKLEGTAFTSVEAAMRRRWFGLLAVLIGALALAACGGGGGQKAKVTTGALPSASEILSGVVDRVATVKSFHFRLEHENGFSPIPLDLKLRSAEGDVEVPGRIRAKLDAEAGGALLRVEVIGIEDKAWMTNPFSREWQELPKGTTIKAIFDPAEGIQAVARSLQHVSVSGLDNVGGSDTYLLEGDVDSGVLKAAVPIAEPGLIVIVKLWADVEDYSILQIRLEGPFAPDEPENIVRILHLSNFDESVSIEPPV
jgi:hypothetical protein